MRIRMRLLLGTLVGLALALGLVPGTGQTAWAQDEVKYLEGAWDEAAGECLLTEESTSSYTLVTGESASWNNGTYVVGGEVPIAGRITVSGTVDLILCDGATLTANSGITVSDGGTLNIYAQSTGENAVS